MGYRTFSDKTTFDDASDALVFTTAALEAHAHADVSSLAKPLAVLLAKGDALAAARANARRALVRAHAAVRSADGFADDEVGEFMRDLLAEVRQDRSAPLYQALFGKLAPSEVQALSLDPELEEIERFVEVLTTASAPAAFAKRWRPRWAKVKALGQSALAARKKAIVGLAEAQAEIVRWLERADRRRRAIDGALTVFAAEGSQGRGFNDRFFPALSGRTRKKTADPEPQPVA